MSSEKIPPASNKCCIYNGYRYSWDSLTADLPEIAPLLASLPDDDPARTFVASEASAALLESGGTQRGVIEISRQDASTKKLLGKASPWDLLLQFATKDPPRYEKYSQARHADLFRLAFSYDHGQQLLAGLLDAAPTNKSVCGLLRGDGGCCSNRSDQAAEERHDAR